MPEKPPYRVPSMASIRRRRRNGLTVVSTFAGAGGSCTGYEMAGFEVLWANEFEPNAAETYALNHPRTIVDTRDIREVTAAEILAATGGKVPDVLDGSPPCQSFSMAGQRQRRWGQVRDHADGTRQRADDLFFEYVRLLGELRPRAFVAENVAGIAAGASKGVFKQVHRALGAQGYRVRARILDAQWLGVPQCRRRVFFVGMREDLDLEPPFPDPLPYRYSIADACPWLAGTYVGWDGYDGPGSAHLHHGEGASAIRDASKEPARTVRSAGFSQYVTARRRRVKGRRSETRNEVDGPAPTIGTYPGEGKGRGLQVEKATLTKRNWNQAERHKHPEASLEEPAPAVTTYPGGGRGRGLVVSGRRAPGFADSEHAIEEPAPTIIADEQRDNFTVRPAAARRARRADEEEPAPTVLAVNGGWSDVDVHGRALTIEEVVRLCSFPDDYRLVGNRGQRWARLGNSVPPLMMAAEARVLAAALLEA